MSQDQRSVSYWIGQLKAGDEKAMRALWDRYFHRLRDFAEKKLRGARKTVSDQGDLAASSLEALWQGAREGRFCKLDNREDLWQLLVVIASRKAANIHRKQQTRGEQGESAIVGSEAPSKSLAELVRSADFDISVEDLSVSCEELLDQLDDKHHEVALMRLAGYTNQEIADKRDCSVKSVERYLHLIRAIWSQQLDP